MTITKAVFAITASVSGTQAVKQLSKNINEASTAADKTKRSFAQGALAIKAFAGAFAAIGVTAFIKNSIDLADNLNDISQRTGVAVEALAKYKVQAENSGSSIEQLALGIGKLNRAIIEAQNGSGTQASAFKALGVQIKDINGNLRPTQDVLEDVAEAFSQYEDGAGKAAAAVALFGKSGEQLIPFLNLGKQGVKEFALEIDTNLARKADALNDKLGVLGGKIQNFGLSMANQLLPTLTDAAEAFEDNGVAAEAFLAVIKTLQVAFVGLEAAVRIVILATTTFFQGAINSGNALAGVLQGIASFDYDAIGNAITKLGTDNAELAKNSVAEFAKIATDTDAAVKRIEQARNYIYSEPAGPPTPEQFNKGKAGKGQFGPEFKPQLLFNPQADADAAAAAKKAASEADSAAKKVAESYKRAGEAAQEFIATQREEIATLQLESSYIGKTSIEIEKLKDARKFDLEVAAKVKDLSAQAREAFLAETEAIKAQRQEVMQLNYEKSRSFEAGAQSFLTKYVEDATNAAEQTKKVFENAFQGAEDALTEFAMTGKLNFKEFASSIIEDLIRINIQQNVLAPIAGALGGALGGGKAGGGLFAGIKSFFGFESGGIMTARGALPLNRYATGGIATSPQLALFGEGRQPEAYVPLPDGRRIPVAMQGGGGGTNNVSVVVNVENGSTSTQSDSKQGGEIGKLIASVVKSTLINEKRPGGLLAA